MKLLFIILFTSSLFAEDIVISQEDINIVQALVASLNVHQQQVSSAIKKQETRICKEHRIKIDVCQVVWEKGKVTIKPKEEVKK